MHKVRLLVLLSAVLLAGSIAQAQTATGETLMLNLPRQSQHAPGDATHRRHRHHD